MKQELVSSHPGVDDPGAFVTVTCICDTCSTTTGAVSSSIGSIPITLTVALISSPIDTPPWFGQSVKKFVKTCASPDIVPSGISNPKTTSASPLGKTVLKNPTPRVFCWASSTVTVTRIGLVDFVVSLVLKYPSSPAL